MLSEQVILHYIVIEHDQMIDSGNIFSHLHQSEQWLPISLTSVTLGWPSAYPEIILLKSTLVTTCSMNDFII